MIAEPGEPGRPGQPVTVRVPATSANLGPGFDSLGLALTWHDVVRARVTSGGVSVEVRGVSQADVPRDERHLVVRAMRAAFEVAGRQPSGLALECENSIPHGFGLGSSAAAIVAGLLAARALSGELGLERLPDQAVLGLAAEIEGHADNVAACLSGGLTIAWTTGPAGPAGSAGSAGSDGSAGTVGCARFDPLAGLKAVLCVPAVPLATEAARAVLPEVVPHADAAANAARAALLVGTLTQASGSLAASALLDATEDFLHQRYRAGAMPGTAELLAALRGARIPAVVSGAGPAVLALIAPGVAAGPEAVAAIAADSGRPWTVRTLDVDRDGAITNW